MGTPLGPKYIPYSYMDPLGDIRVLGYYIQSSGFGVMVWGTCTGRFRRACSWNG